MKRKAVLGIMLTLLFMGILSLTFEIQPVEASETIYIMADGLVEGTDKITNENNVTYTFTDNINDSIVVERSNIVIDGDGWTLDGLDFTIWEGLNLTGVSNVTIIDINIERFASYSIYLRSASQCVISRNTVTGSEGGIGLFSSTGIKISDNEITGCWEAVELVSSSGNGVSGNNITDNSCGVRLWNSTDNTIAGNSMTANNFAGMQVGSSSNFNSISGNNITNNKFGILLNAASNNNTISGNNITNNNYKGISVSNSSNNIFYHNNFINNTQQVYDSAWDYPQYVPSINVWDDDYPSGGNYWSNYTGVDLDHDGIGDTEHVIYANNTDNYPLMGMFSDFKATSENHVQTICNSSISDFQYNGTAICCNVTGKDGTAGFCRICIPRALMNETYKVFVNGTEVQCNLLPCSNTTHSYLYFTYNHSTQEVIIIPEFPSFLTLPIFMITTVLAAIVYRRKFAIQG